MATKQKRKSPTPEERKQMVQLSDEGWSQKEIAKKVNWSRRTVSKHVKIEKGGQDYRGAEHKALESQLTVHLAAIPSYLDMVAEQLQTPDPLVCAEHLVPLVVPAPPTPIVEGDVPPTEWQQLFPCVVETPQMRQAFAHAPDARTAWEPWRQAMEAYVSRVLDVLMATQAEVESRTGLRRTTGFTKEVGLAGDVGWVVLAFHLRRAAGEEMAGDQVQVGADGRSLVRQERTLGIAPPENAAACAQILNHLLDKPFPEAKEVGHLWQQARASAKELLRAIREAQALPPQPERTCAACEVLGITQRRKRHKKGH